MNKLLVVLFLSLLMFINAANGTWSQTFYEDGHSGVGGDFSFNAFAVKVVVGHLEMPTVSISDVTWTVMQENPTTASASGDIHTPGDLLYFTLNFSGNSTDSLVLDYVAYSGNTMVQNQRATYNGAYWTIGNVGTGEWTPQRSEIPEPATILILGTGTLCLLRWKKG
jgi:hypothetical protein